MTVQQSFLVKAPPYTTYIHPYTNQILAKPDVYDWLLTNNIEWSIVTDGLGRNMRFIFQVDQHAVLFSLRWG